MRGGGRVGHGAAAAAAAGVRAEQRAAAGCGAMPAGVQSPGISVKLL
jgi:hypothetical protein